MFYVRLVWVILIRKELNRSGHGTACLWSHIRQAVPYRIHPNNRFQSDGRELDRLFAMLFSYKSIHDFEDETRAFSSFLESSSREPDFYYYGKFIVLFKYLSKSVFIPENINEKGCLIYIFCLFVILLFCNQ